jgi:asparagine synthase (glutamine-hydrolysing)
MSISSPVALAHIDVDWYDPVKTCLTRIFPFLAVGGSMIVDDYYSWGGAKKATDEFLATIPNQFVADDSSRSLRITRL